jgi:hypothetical protein
VNVIANARLAQEAQRRALVTAITGTAPATTRTERRLAAGFDGGARPMQLRAPETHDQLVVRLVLLSRTFRSETF